MYKVKHTIRICVRGFEWKFNFSPLSTTLSYSCTAGRFVFFPSLIILQIDFPNLYVCLTLSICLSKRFCFSSIRSAEPLCGATALPSVGRVHYCLLFPFLLSRMESNILYHNFIGWLGNNLMFFLLTVF